MRHKIALTVYIFSTLLLLSCGNKNKSINLEQKNNESAQHIVALGLGTIGIIDDSQIFVHYLNENHTWMLDKVSQFSIPDWNNGVLPLGMGTIGILEKDTIHFYYLDAQFRWVKDEQVKFILPKDYVSVHSMRQNWELGMIAVEKPAGVFSFYFLNSDNQWEEDEAALFTMPENVDEFIIPGAMEIAILQGNRLGIFKLSDAGEWEFLDNMVLRLPEDTKAIIPFEPGTIGILNEQNIIQFYEKETLKSRWVVDEKMNFSLNVFYENLSELNEQEARQ